MKLIVDWKKLYMMVRTFENEKRYLKSEKMLLNFWFPKHSNFLTIYDASALDSLLRWLTVLAT